VCAVRAAFTQARRAAPTGTERHAFFAPRKATFACFAQAALVVLQPLRHRLSAPAVALGTAADSMESSTPNDNTSQPLEIVDRMEAPHQTVLGVSSTGESGHAGHRYGKIGR
jgi:hypothetical protein